jgi:hypothetical protein
MNKKLNPPFLNFLLHNLFFINDYTKHALRTPDLVLMFPSSRCLNTCIIESKIENLTSHVGLKIQS